MSTFAAPPLVESSLAEVRRIVLDGLGSLKAKVYLFGSRATGDARESSDIDVAVLPLEPLRPGMLADIRDALELADDRNLTVRTYNEPLARALTERLPRHAMLLREWLDRLKS